MKRTSLDAAGQMKPSATFTIELFYYLVIPYLVIAEVFLALQFGLSIFKK